MKKTVCIILSLLTLASLCVSISASAENMLPFTDVKNSAWYYSAVSEVYAEGIMEGKAEGKFAPGESMTRAELVTVLCRLSGDDVTGKGTSLSFRDTKKSAWYADSVAWSVESGVVAGYTDNTFKPNTPILRQELAKMLVTFLEYMNIPLDGVPLTESFADSARFPAWAAEYIETLRLTGLMGGDTAGNFGPAKGASRAEIATVITRLLPMLNGDMADIFVKGKTEYTIVYDDSNVDLSKHLGDLIYRFRLDYSVNIVSVKASVAEADYGKEIVVGPVRDAAVQLEDSLESAGDFAVRFDGDDIILVANDSTLYPYLLKVFEMEVLSKTENRSLSVDKSYSFTFSNSPLSHKSYEQYLVDIVKSGEDVTSRDILTLFKGVEYKDIYGYDLDYRIYVPAYYDAAKEYPVLLFLHGSGEIGDDNSLQLNNMISTMFNQDNALLTEAIVVCPQCSPEAMWWDPQSLKVLLDSIASQYSTDTDRYYVMGLSMGGYGTWDLISNYTDTFAAAVPICGGASESVARRLIDFPLYVVHGAKDSTVPVGESRSIVNALLAAGSTSVIYEELPNYGHAVWGYVAQKPEVLEWLFSHRLSDRG